MEDNTVKLDLSQVGEVQPSPPNEPIEAQPEQETPEVKEEPKVETPKNDSGDYVINLNTQDDAVQQVQGETEEGVLRDGRLGPGVEQEVPEENQTLELIQEEEASEVVTEEEVLQALEPVKEEQQIVVNDPLPEGINKFVEFMNDTGLEGTEAMQAYVNLNKNPDEMIAGDLLHEYYKATKPFLNNEQITKQLQKKYTIGEDTDPDRAEEINMAFQEELYKAKQHFTGNKEKYLADLKLRQQKSLPLEAQEAVEFYSEYKSNQDKLTQTSSVIQKQIDQVYSEDFKGFDFKVGEAKYRYKVNDPVKQKENHKDWNKVFSGFFNEDGSLADAVGYNKALFAAVNADKLAAHFYEQGKADAVKNSAIKSKNIDMEARQDNSAVVTPDGQTVRVVSGESKSSLKPKMTIKGWNS